MNVFAKFDKIPSKILKVIKETKRNGHTYTHTHGRKDGQRKNSIPTHKHSLRGYNNLEHIIVGVSTLYPLKIHPVL